MLAFIAELVVIGVVLCILRNIFAWPLARLLEAIGVSDPTEKARHVVSNAGAVIALFFAMIGLVVLYKIGVLSAIYDAVGFIFRSSIEASILLSQAIYEIITR